MINVGSLSLSDVKTILNLYLFGQATAPEFLSDRIRPENTPGPTIQLNMMDYLTSGAGRYANPARSEAFQTFFNDTTLEDKTYTWDQIQKALGIGDKSLKFGVSQYSTDVGSADHLWRSFIFGSTGFELDLSNAQFVVNGDQRSVTNFTLKADDDNFDFVSSNAFAKFINKRLEPMLDLWGLGLDSGITPRTVEIEFTGNRKSYQSYHSSQFSNEQSTNISLAINENEGQIRFLDDFIDRAINTSSNAGQFFGLAGDEILGYHDFGRTVTVYGTNKDDDFTLKQKLSPFLFNLFNDYTLNIVGGEGNDEIEGYRNDDLLIGGAGDDILRGGRGNDMIYGDFDPEKSTTINGIDTVDYSLVESGFIFNDKPDNGIEIVLSDEFINVTDDGTGGADILHSIEVIKGTEFIDTLKVENTNSFTDLKIQDFGGSPVTQDKDGNNLPWEKVIQKVLDIETEFDLNIDVNGTGVINFDGGEKITLEGFTNSGAFEDKPIVYIKGNSEESVVNVQSEGSYLIDVSDGKGKVTVGDGLDWIVLGENDTKLSVSDTSIALNGGATYTIQGGEGEDRLFIKGSMVGIAPDEQTGAEELFPILGGVAIAQQFTYYTYTGSVVDRVTYDEVYDSDQDGNIEYHFLTRAVDFELHSMTLDGELYASAELKHGENFSNNLDIYNNGDIRNYTNGFTLEPYKPLLTYEMDGNDLIVYFEEDTFAIKLNNFSNGDYGINLTGPFNIVNKELREDRASVDQVNNSALTNANNAIKALNDDKFYKEFLPDFEEEDKDSPSPEENQNIEGTEQADTAIGKAGDDTIDTRAGNDRAFGGAGNDHITTGDGDDSAYGGSGNDTIVGGSGEGDDHYDGGLGNDTVVYSSASNAIFVNLENGSAFGDEIDSDTLVSLENIISGDGDDNLIGDEEDNQITGAGGDDRIDGKDGNDVAIYTGTRADYQIISLSSNRVRITDLRQDSPDGTDEVSNVEKFSFVDGVFTYDALFSTNNKPIIISNDLQTNEDESVSFTKESLLLNDSDPDGDIISFVSAQSAENGQLIENSDGTFTFIPDQDFNGTASFIYTITDGNGVEVSSTVNVEVAGINDAPVVQTPMEEQYSAEDRPVNIVVPETLFSDIDGDTLTLTATLADGSPLPGWLSFNSDTKTFTGTPPSNFSGPINLRVLATDGVDTVESVFDLNIFAVNDGPEVGNDKGFEVEYNTPLNISALALLANDTDAEGDELTVSSVGSAFNGTVELTSDGQITFTPTDGYTGPAYFLYTVTDENGGIGNGIVSLEVGATNSAPVVQTEIEDQTSDEDSSWSFTVPENTFSDVDGDTITLTATLADGSELPAWLSFDSNTQTFSGTPPQDFNGDTNLRVTASDGEFEVSDDFNLTIDPVNDAPIVVQEISDQTSNEDTGWSFTIPTSTFSDVDGDALTLTATLTDGSELPAWLSFDSTTQTFSGTPPQDFNGDIALSVTASDGELEVSEGFNLTITPVNDAPIVVQEISDQTSDEDTSWSYAIPASTFSDVDGDALTLTATLADGTELPAWLSFDSNTQTFSGTPPQDFNGDINLRVTASDGEFDVSEDFDLTVNAVNDAPVAANDDSFETDEDTPLTIAANSLLLNDVDVDGDLLSIISVADAENGSVEIDSNGDIIFTPTANYNGPASFRYTISDGNGGVSSAIASLTIHAINDAPTDLISSTLEIEENSLAGSEVGMFSVSDVDLGDSHTYSIVGGTGATQFVFEGDKLVVADGADLDFETTTSLSLDVLATDAAGLTTQNSFEIGLLDDPTDNNGNTTDDIIYGTFQDDILDGEGGDDTIFALWGNDHLIGGAGADKLYGGFGFDTADYSGSSAGVNVSLSRSYLWWGNQTASGGDAEGDQLFSIENLIGSSHDDQLKGNWKSNRLEGGEGNDLLTGGWGHDQFVFKSGDDVDTITDFDPGYSFWGFNFSRDKVMLDVDGFDEFADIQDAMTSSGGYWNPETTIDFGNGDTLIFKGVHQWQLSANDFDFV